MPDNDKSNGVKWSRERDQSDGVYGYFRKKTI